MHDKHTCIAVTWGKALRAGVLWINTLKAPFVSYSHVTVVTVTS